MRPAAAGGPLWCCVYRLVSDPRARDADRRRRMASVARDEVEWAKWIERPKVGLKSSG